MSRTLSYYAKNDDYIEQLIADPNYQVREDGTVWRKVANVWAQTGKAISNKRHKSYYHLKYKGKMLLVSRIVYRKFHGPLQADLVVEHLDGNSLNNLPANVNMLITRQENSYHAQALNNY